MPQFSGLMLLPFLQSVSHAFTPSFSLSLMWEDLLPKLASRCNDSHKSAKHLRNSTSFWSKLGHFLCTHLPLLLFLFIYRFNFVTFSLCTSFVYLLSVLDHWNVVVQSFLYVSAVVLISIVCVILFVNVSALLGQSEVIDDSTTFLPLELTLYGEGTDNCSSSVL